jgi:hypothetical protein
MSMQRRTLLKLGVGTGAVLALAGAGVALWTPGLARGRLSPDARLIARRVADAVLEGSLPPDGPAREAALDAHAARFESTVQGLPAVVRGELSDLFALLGTPPARWAITGLSTSWEKASRPEITSRLEAMRLSSMAVRQQVYHALRDLTNAAWYADPVAWGALGYPGPAIPS